MSKFIHRTAEISEDAQIGDGTKIWHHAQIREGAKLGQNCIVGKNVYIDFDVSIGNNVKIQNNACLYHGLEVEDGVFIGPGVIFTNDKIPRAINPNGDLKQEQDWNSSKIKVRYGASIGAGAIILPNVTIGKFAMIGSGSVITKDVPAYVLTIGNPGKLVGKVNESGEKV